MIATFEKLAPRGAIICKEGNLTFSPATECPVPGLPGRPCPICGAPCPGVCPFSKLAALEPLGILVFLEPGCKPFYVNHQAQKLLGANSAELAASQVLQALGLTTASASHPPLPTSEQITTSAEASPVHLETTLSLHHRQLKAKVYRDAASTLVFLVDVTELYRLLSMAAEIELSDALNRCFSLLRHEIGNSVSSIGMSLRVLEVKLRKGGSTELLEYSSRISHELQRITDLLNSFKTAALCEDYCEAIIDVRKVVSSVFSLFSSAFSFLAIELKTAHQTFAAFGSERLLEHALINVVRNAVEAVQALSEPMVLISLGICGSKTRIDVEDNGPGIPQELSEEVFKPFFSTKPGGTGLGLFLAKTWIARMGGTLVLESEPGRTRFSIFLRRPSDAPGFLHEPRADR